MKKWILISIAMGVLPLSMQAQDDVYFVPKKKVASETHRAYERSPRETYHYSGSSRSVDEYNRHFDSYYETIPGDSSDIINFDGQTGVYPDSLEDFRYTKRMTRFDDYTPSSDAYWEGYSQGRRDSWHSPWYYSSYYPWYDSWYYDPWYYDSWYYGGRWGWSWHWGYYDPWYYGWYYPHYYSWGYSRPYYSGGYVGHRPVHGVYGTHRRSFGRGVTSRGGSLYSNGRGSFGASRSRASFGRSSNGSFGSRSTSSGTRRTYGSGFSGSSSNSFGASSSGSSNRSFGSSSSSSSRSFGGGGSSSGGGSRSFGGGGGSRSGGGSFGRHR